MKPETKNRIRRLFGMQEYCPECGLETPAFSYPAIDGKMLASGNWVRCSSCGQPKSKGVSE